MQSAGLVNHRRRREPHSDIAATLKLNYSRTTYFYPQGRVGKAMVLMILGSLIAMGMIGFSIQREAFQQ